MEYFEMGFTNTRSKALINIAQLYISFQDYTIKQLNKTSKNDLKRDRVEHFRTPTLKYLAGSLVLSGEIEGTKEYAIQLIEEAAKEGNTMAMTQMGILFVDGSDLSFDCSRATEYFSKDALSRKVFQQRIELAKLGMKKGLFMFSFIKYTQLMMVGYRNAFINAMYLYEVYSQEVFKFHSQAWSLSFSKHDPTYVKLTRENEISRLEETLEQVYNPVGEQLVTKDKVAKYTLIDNATIGEYLEYIRLKIVTIGILKHDISILRFFKYKKTKDSL